MLSDVIFEFVRRGPLVKVSAIDAVSGREISIGCPATASRAEMEEAALKRLAFVLERERVRERGEGRRRRSARSASDKAPGFPKGRTSLVV